MEIILNGAAHQLTDNQTVADLVSALNLSEKSVAIAINRCIISRQQWSEHQLQAQDQIDVVHAIGGG